MTKTYLFDWGNTLMVDFPNQSGKMCDWPNVEPIHGAYDTLKHLSKHHKVYIATNAADSSEQEIKHAFSRVGLDTFISGYFCKSNLGVDKGSPDFFPAIIKRLNASPTSVTMVGDTLEKDIIPAIEAGINAVWLSTTSNQNTSADPFRRIERLSELRE